VFARGWPEFSTMKILPSSSSRKREREREREDRNVKAKECGGEKSRIFSYKQLLQGDSRGNIVSQKMISDRSNH